jgi:hypothetical protein
VQIRWLRAPINKKPVECSGIGSRDSVENLLARALPPPTNRGVTPTPEKPQKPKPGAAFLAVRTRSRQSENGGFP